MKEEIEMISPFFTNDRMCKLIFGKGLFINGWLWFLSVIHYVYRIVNLKIRSKKKLNKYVKKEINNLCKKNRKVFRGF